MTARRRARAAAPASAAGIPALLADRTHPDWNDPDRIREDLGALMLPVDEFRLRFYPRSLHGVLLHRWMRERDLTWHDIRKIKENEHDR